MERSRGGLTNKIHSLVDSHGLPATAGAKPPWAHDIRLAGKLPSRPNPGQRFLPTEAMTRTGSRSLP